MPVLPRGKLYVDGQDVSAPPTSAPSNQPPSKTSSPTPPQNTSPRGKLYIDGQDISAGPPTTPQRQTALSLLVESGDAKEVHTPSNWLQVAKPNQRNTNPQPNVTVAPDTVTAGTFDAYHPSTREKIERWFDRNVDKIPVVNFFHLIHEQAQTAKKETMIELAEEGKTKEAKAIGAAYGILIDAFVDAPGTIYETAKSVWNAIPSHNMGALGLRHETASKKIITRDPDKEIENELIMAKAAPKTYRAEQKLREAQQKLIPEITKLNEQAEQLKKQANWFEENRKKAENDPFYARLYNTEAIEYNRQVIEYNQKVREIEAQLKALGVDEANKQVEEFNENLKKVNKNFAIGELTGSIVASAVLAEAVAPTIRAVAPEKVVMTETSFTDVFGDTAGTRTTVKETVYKGWLRKKPVETRYSTTLEVDGDIRYMKSFINGPEGVALRVGGKDTREFVLNKFMSTEPLKNEPGPAPSAPVGPEEFEKITGKPWPTGVIKKELETQTILKTTGGQELSIIELEDKNIVVGKTTFDKKPFSPEFSLGAKETVLSPEDFALLQKITNVKSVRVGEKYLKVSRSGNVVQTFYDPPAGNVLVERTQVRMTPDLGMFRVNPIQARVEEGVLLVVPATPSPDTAIGKKRDIGQPQLIAPNIKEVEKRDIRFLEKPEETRVSRPTGIDVIQLKKSLRRQYRPWPDVPPQIQEPVQTQVQITTPTIRDTTPDVTLSPPEEVQLQKTAQIEDLTSTIRPTTPSTPRLTIPFGRPRLPASGALIAFPRAFGRGSWTRKLSFWKNPFGGGKRKKKKHKRRGRHAKKR